MAPSWLLLAWALGATAPVAALPDTPAGSAQGALLPATTIDPDSRVEFTLHTRWGQTLRGRFPGVSGGIERDADGRRRVRIVLDAATVDIAGSPRYTRFARGPSFFDVARHPTVEFVSDPYPDPDGRDSKLAVVDVEAGKRLPRPVPLAAIKADPAFADLGLVRMSRLSVVPVPAEQWKRLLAMGGAR